jgi:hypothetical protein
MIKANPNAQRTLEKASYKMLTGVLSELPLKYG